MAEYKLVVDCANGTQEYVELTEKEISDRNAAQAAEDARQAELAAARAAEEAARESARAKLASLGLTEAEVAALVK